VAESGRQQALVDGRAGERTGGTERRVDAWESAILRAPHCVSPSQSGADPGICVWGGASPSLSPLPSPLLPFPPSFLLPSLPPTLLSCPILSPPLPPLPSHPIPFPPLPSPPLRSRPPVLRLGDLGERSSSPSGSGRSLAAKRFLVNCRLKIAPVVAMVTKYTST